MFISVTSSLARVNPFFFADYIVVPFLIVKLYFRHSANKDVANLRYFVFIRYGSPLCSVKDYFAPQSVD